MAEITGLIQALGTGKVWGAFSSMLVLIVLAMIRAFIVNAIRDWKLYKTRRYDKDGNPLTKEKVTEKCAATGNPIPTTVEGYRYKFWTEHERQVCYSQILDGKKTYFTVSYSAWRAILTGEEEPPAWLKEVS